MLPLKPLPLALKALSTCMAGGVAMAVAVAV